MAADSKGDVQSDLLTIAENLEKAAIRSDQRRR